MPRALRPRASAGARGGGAAGGAARQPSHLPQDLQHAHQHGEHRQELQEDRECFLCNSSGACPVLQCELSRVFADKPGGAGVAERAEGPDLAGDQGEDSRTDAGAAGRVPVRAASHRAHTHPEHYRL